jgi:hypothetical protein
MALGASGHDYGASSQMVHADVDPDVRLFLLGQSGRHERPGGMRSGRTRRHSAQRRPRACREVNTLFTVDALFSRPRTKNDQGHQADAHQQPWPGNPPDTGSACDFFCKSLDEVVVATRQTP